MLKYISLHACVYTSIFFICRSELTVPILLFGTILIIVSSVDMLRFEIPDSAVLFLFLLGSYSAFFPEPSLTILDMALGTLLWPMIFQVCRYIYQRWRGFHGLGFGDVKLVAGLGPWLGYTGLNITVFSAACTGILFLLARYLLGRSSYDRLSYEPIPFGSFICVAAWAVFLWNG